jgi:hypothetical protein
MEKSYLAEPCLLDEINGILDSRPTHVSAHSASVLSNPAI